MCARPDAALSDKKKTRHRAASYIPLNWLFLPTNCRHQPLTVFITFLKRPYYTMPARVRASMTVITTQSVCVNNLSLEERDVLDGIRATHEAHKPANTTKAYSRPQVEWHTWCLARAVKNGGKPLEEFPVQERSVEETRRYVLTHAYTISGVRPLKSSPYVI
jgi:hypothetical protein